VFLNPAVFVSRPAGIEAPCSKPQGIFDPQGCNIYSNRSLTPQQAAGNALAPGFKKTLEISALLWFNSYL
jgi:hypothetical protein